MAINKESVADLEINKIYKCGEDFVKIVVNLRDSKNHPESFFQFIGVKCNKNGVTTCVSGFFGRNGWCRGNPLELRHNLTPFVNGEEKRKIALERILKIEEELAILKKDL